MSSSSAVSHSRAGGNPMPRMGLGSHLRGNDNPINFGLKKQIEADNTGKFKWKRYLIQLDWAFPVVKTS